MSCIDPCTDCPGWRECPSYLAGEAHRSVPDFGYHQHGAWCHPAADGCPETMRAPYPSPDEQAVIDRFGIFAEEECGAVSEVFAGLGRLRCELRPAHDGPHREREDGLAWDDPWTGSAS